MKPLIPILFLFCWGMVLVQNASADGFPFDPESQEVTEDALRLKLSAAQVDQVSASGLVTFTDEQLAYVRRFYPAALPLQRVVAATFNDNHEGLTDKDVHLFWVRPDEVAVTINPKVVASKELAMKALSEAIISDNYPQRFRLSPDGRIFHLGKLIEEKEAFRILSEFKFPEPSDDSRYFDVVVPPPHRSFQFRDREKLQADNARVEKLLRDLEAFGKSRDLVIDRSW